MLFGLTQKIKAAVEHHVAHEKGEDFAKQKGPGMDWIKAHKTQIGFGFAMLEAAVQASPWRASAGGYFGLVSAFLIGAGILPSDYHSAIQSNKK